MAAVTFALWISFNFIKTIEKLWRKLFILPHSIFPSVFTVISFFPYLCSLQLTEYLTHLPYIPFKN